VTFIAVAGMALGLGTALPAWATPTFPANSAGDWAGTIGPSGARRHVFVHIRNTSAGYVGRMDSPETSASSVPIAPIDAPADTLAFAGGGARFRGDWDASSGQWRGTWTESGASWPVSLKYDLEDTSPARIARRPLPTVRTPDASPPAAGR
jgi:hypothetical protein